MRVGILDILALPSHGLYETAYRLILTKQYASVTPQAISVWCRQLGHETTYAVYYGLGNPERLLPRDLDLVFIACYTQASPLAYALAKLYRQAGVRTVVGGPHARSFPADCLRFFDLVVRECDKGLVADILAGHHDPGSIISSRRPFDDLPTVEERLPEIRASAFLWGRQPYFMSIVPMLASVGCPYACDFCVDWNNPYRLLPLDRLAADLEFLTIRMPGRMIGFHDPNFAVKFDQVLEVLEAPPPHLRPAYVMESSLSILRGARITRLRDTNCIAVAPGIESWTDYSNKAGVSRVTGSEKVRQVAEHFRHLHEHVPYLQGNLIFGLDTDRGDEPVALTREFMDATPFVWPTFNIPVPFGGTPLFHELLANGRVLRNMPFGFYYAPYTTISLRHYDPASYYEKLLSLMEHASSPAMLRRRYLSASSWKVKVMHWARTVSTRVDLKLYRRLLAMLRSDSNFFAFHEGRSAALPDFYQREYEKMLGRYADLLTRADRTPDLTQQPPVNPFAHEQPAASAHEAGAVLVPPPGAPLVKAEVDRTDDCRIHNPA
jgi:radical SAM superfamily enzyme YgiQ (UPF0313 family)